MNDYSIYVHFPFCKSRCVYCDFVSNVVSPLPVAEVTSQLKRELMLRRQWIGMQRPPVSIYFGGGTPSLWSMEAMAKVLEACGPTEGDIEITVEMNPQDVSSQWVGAALDAGINRFSLGVQSMNDSRLQWLGRRHSVMDVQRAMEVLRECGATNVSVDFIYATPGLDDAAMRLELLALCDLTVEHVSAYELTIADGTPLSRMDLNEVPGEHRATMWHSIGEILHRYGLERYEVSNYAKSGRRSVHNCHYWKGGVYLGIGSGAHGFVKMNDVRVRYSNGGTLGTWRDVQLTIDALNRDIAIGDGFFEQISDLDFARELMMLGLRCTDGVNLLALQPLIENNDDFKKTLAQLLNDGWLTRCGARVVPGEEAMLLADELALRFF
ncbi:MAG: radical SAM family heme chaperone HemW [Deltaproteobacteria bacterium]|nr:radical SAM family heme chaperone HemW [Deltaproteobacteria bacterium]